MQRSNPERSNNENLLISTPGLEVQKDRGRWQCSGSWELGPREASLVELELHLYCRYWKLHQGTRKWGKYPGYLLFPDSSFSMLPLAHRTQQPDGRTWEGQVPGSRVGRGRARSQFVITQKVTTVETAFQGSG